MMRVIPTIPPYAPYIGKLLKHPMVSGVRFNTIMPIKESAEGLISRLKKMSGSKDIWIDLKCRQIRTSYGFFFDGQKGARAYIIDGKKYVLDPSNPKAQGTLRTPPWAQLKIDRKIKLNLLDGPVKCWFHDGCDSAYIVDVIDGDNLVMLDGPQRVVGGGESINIVDPSLQIEGYFTDVDTKYMAAAKSLGVHNYMLSYVESDNDINAILDFDSKAIVIAKIESQKGIDWVSESYPKFRSRVRLMAARGDLYVELGRPDKILNPLKMIARSDPTAVVASRLLASLLNGPVPTCSDITDIACMLEIGYNYFMIGDDICFKEDSIMLALDIMRAIDEEYVRK